MKIFQAVDLSSPFAYTGRLLDAATGLQNNFNRWYDASIGRWLSEDPIGFNAGDANLYRYVGNGPVNGTDPSGLLLNSLFNRLYKWCEEKQLEDARLLQNRPGVGGLPPFQLPPKEGEDPGLDRIDLPGLTPPKADDGSN